jgi:hypothetical protein
MLPLKILLVAIPEGSVPELQIRSARSEILPGVDVAPVPEQQVEDRPGVPGDGSGPGRASVRLEYAVDARIFDQDAEFPEAPLRLGRIGYLREQRFVEVLYTPVVYHPGLRQARHYPEITADVVFGLPAGIDPSAILRPFRPDPLFEEIYRAGLVNYEQGKMFRVPAGTRAPLAGGGTDGTGEVTTLSTSDDEVQFVAEPVPTSAESITPGTGRYKVLVARPAIYSLGYDYLNARAPDLLAVDPQTLVLRAGGVEVPIRIRDAAGGSGELDGRFDPGDSLEFFGRPKRDEPTAVLNFSYGNSLLDVLQASDFTDTQVYWLTSEEPAGAHLRISASIDAAPVLGLPLAPDFEHAAVWDENTLYLPLGDASDPFFSLESLLANTTSAQRDLVLPLPELAPVTAQASVRIRLRGGSSSNVSGDDHLTRAWVNDDTASGRDFSWDGETIHEEELAVPQSVLSDPTTVHLRALGVAGVSVDRQYIDTVTIRYRRRFVASGDHLAFAYPNQDARFQIDGFSGPGATIYEVSRVVSGTAEADPVLIRGAATSGSPGSTRYTFDVRADLGAGAPPVRSYVIAGPCVLSGPCRLSEPDGFVRAADPVLRDPASAADYLVVGARDTLDPAPGGSLDALLAHRRDRQGLTSRLVFVDQIYDEFSFGLRDPNAIRAFLAYAFEHWKGPSGDASPPSFVLLVGDATPDYKNTLGRVDWIDQVPTPIMLQRSSIIAYYSSDNWIASFRGDDQLPDVALGRISARSAAAAAAVFDKILRYEQSPPSGGWKGRAILAASEGKDDFETGLFEAPLDSVAAAHFAQSPYSTPDPPLYFARPPWNATDSAGWKSDLIDELGRGAAVLYYIGHGAFDIWARSAPLFRTQDAAALTNDRLLPFMVNVNCLSGGFHYLLPAGSIGEAMTNNPAGGAIATLAPSTLSNAYIGEDVSATVLPSLFGPRRERLPGLAASSLRAELWSVGRVVDLQGFTFLGDPATVLATPAPPPPAGLGAEAGNGEVTLSWTAPSEPAAGTRIHRATGRPDGLYAPVTCEETSATSCVDRTVINATTYYYAAASLDAEGFEGRWSNFNTDCATGGPDCVQATPINPDPPSVPTGLTVRDPGTGGQLEVTWNPNPERDLKSYILHYGTAPGQYETRVTLGATVTSTLLSGLIDSLRYYIAISATNTSGLESATSPEVAGVPHLIQGIAPPRAISDLSIARSGSDLLLSWSRPTVDIYGRPTTVVAYNIYRGESPGFAPFASGPWMLIADGSTTTALDAGAYDAPRNFYYLVTAIDADGLMSGAGRELPYGIGDLQVQVAGPDTLRLAWSAVTTDLQGLPTLIDRYQVHAGNRPIARGELGSTTLLRDDVRSLSVDLTVDLSPGSAPLYLSVIAVDDRGNLSPF